MHWRNVFFLVRKLKHKLKLQCTHDEHFPPFKRFLSGFLSKCSLRVFFPALKSNQAQLTSFSATGLPELFSVIAVMFFLGRKLKHKLKLHCTHEKHFLPSIRFLSNFVKVFTENFPSELKSNQAQLTTFSATQLLFVRPATSKYYVPWPKLAQNLQLLAETICTVSSSSL